MYSGNALRKRQLWPDHVGGEKEMKRPGRFRRFVGAQRAVINSVRKVRKLPLSDKLDVLKIIPKFLRLLVHLAKSPRTDAKLKLIATGTVAFVGAVIALNLSGVSRLGHIAIGASIGSALAAWWGGLVGGPVEAFFTGIGGGITGGVLGFVIGQAVEICLVILVVLFTFGFCIRAMQEQEFTALAKELYGDKEGTALTETLSRYSEKLKHLVDPIRDACEQLVERFAKRFGKKKDGESLDDIQAKVEDNITVLTNKAEKTDRKKRRSKT
jgi:hypothetical protein